MIDLTKRFISATSWCVAYVLHKVGFTPKWFHYSHGMKCLVWSYWNPSAVFHFRKGWSTK